MKSLTIHWNKLLKMTNFDITWRFAVIGFLLAIVVQLGKIEKKFDKYFDVPDYVVEPQDGKDVNR